MNEFIYLYRRQPMSERPSPEQMQKMMQKWGAWMKSLSDKGNMKTIGQPLEDGGKVAGGNQLVTDGPYAEAKDLVCGFTVVLADSLDHAVELTAGCPIFDGGGLVEVRPVIQLNM